jgi:hemerythrin
MEWSESYATGFPEIDLHHQTLFKAVAAMTTAVASADGADEYLRLLKFLDRYCRDHFTFEEGCMERHRCAAFEANKAQHEGLLQMLVRHRQWHRAHGYDPHDATILVHTLQHWLRSHIATVDRNLRHCLKSTPS